MFDSVGGWEAHGPGEHKGRKVRPVAGREKQGKTAGGMTAGLR